MFIKIKLHEEGMMLTEKLLESFQGWNAYAKWANSFKLRISMIKIIFIFPQFFYFLLLFS